MSLCLKKLALSTGKVLPFSEFAATFLGVCSHLSPAYLITTPRTLNFQLSTFNLKKMARSNIPMTINLRQNTNDDEITLDA